MEMPLRGNQQPDKILVVVGASGMGDAVEALPVFEMIGEHWPGVHLGAGYFREKQRPILEKSPYVSETGRLFGTVRYAWKPLKGLLRNVRAMRGYEKVFFLYRKSTITWPLLLAANLAGAEPIYRHGYRYIDKRRTACSDFPAHVFLQIVTADLLLGSPLTRLREPRLFLSQEEKLFAEDYFSRHGLGNRPVVMINTQGFRPGVGLGVPDWGIRNYAEVANALVDWGADVIVNGGTEEQVEEFASVSNQLRKHVILLDGQFPCQLAAVIEKCQLFIGGNSGPRSLAMAVGTPTINVEGPGEHAYPGQGRTGPAWWPRDPRHQFISKSDWCLANMGEECRCRQDTREFLKWRRLKRARKHLGLSRPWRKLKGVLGMNRETPLPTYPCLEAIRVEEVVEAATAQLSKRVVHSSGSVRVGA